MSTHTYDSEFFDYIELGSRRSAEVVTQILLNYLSIRSVLDVGCGRGTWLDVWQQQGLDDVFGIDGDYLEMGQLKIDPQRFKPHNLAAPVNLNRQFDLVQSLEVAEHIPAQYANTFVKNLIAHSDMILFSAAPPGQGGEFHVNEQDYTHWRNAFAQYGYQLVDFMRPQLIGQTQVEPWYRYNTLLFVRSTAIANLPAPLGAALYDPQKPVKDYAPAPWRLRRAILRRLPQGFVSWLATIKHWLVLKLRRHILAQP